MSNVRFCLSAFLLTLGGCATVDPSRDFDSVQNRVVMATQVSEAYRPGMEAEIQTKVESLLANGLHVDEAVQIALLNHRGLQASFMEIGMSRAEVVQAGLLSNPTLGLGLRIPEGGGLLDVEAGIAQNLADLWHIPARVKAAEKQLQQTILSIAYQANQHAHETQLAYYRAVAAQRALEIAVENLQALQKIHGFMVDRQEAGTGNQLETNLAYAEVTRSRVSIENAKLAVVEARGQLARMMGLHPVLDPLELAEGLPEEIGPITDEEGMLRLAREHRLDIQALREQVASAEATLRLQQLAVWRDVGVGLELERGGRGPSRGSRLAARTALRSIQERALALPEFELAEQEGPDYVLGPSLSISVPIFDQNQAQIAIAEYRLRQLRKQEESWDMELTQQLHLARSRYEATRSLLQLYEDELMPQSRANLEFAQQSHQAGETGFLSVLEAERTLLQVQQDVVGAQIVLAEAGVMLGRIIGVPLEHLEELLLQCEDISHSAGDEIDEDH